MQLHNMHPLYLTLPCQQQPAPHPFETHPRHNKDQCGQICSTCRCIWHNRDWWRCCYHRCYRGNHRRLHTHQLWRNFRQGWGSWRAGAQHGTKDVPCFGAIGCPHDHRKNLGGRKMGQNPRFWWFKSWPFLGWWFKSWPLKKGWWSDPPTRLRSRGWSLVTFLLKFSGLENCFRQSFGKVH